MSFTNYFYCVVIKFYQLPVHQRTKANLTARLTCLHKTVKVCLCPSPMRYLEVILRSPASTIHSSLEFFRQTRFQNKLNLS